MPTIFQKLARHPHPIKERPFEHYDKVFRRVQKVSTTLGIGLDADTLDGIDSTGFALAGHAHAHSALTGLDFASAGHTDFLSTNTAQTITAQKIIDSSTALRFGHAAGATLSHAASGVVAILTGDLNVTQLNDNPTVFVERT